MIIPLNEFLNAVIFVLSSTYFTFDNVIYKQTFGLPMGSSLSPLIADIVLQDIENKALYKFNKIVSFYFWYVDDIAVLPNKIQEIFDYFNAFYDRIKFTLGMKVNRSINFLDLSINV